MKEDSIKVKARITLYTTKNGGRQTPIFTGYSPNHVFDYKLNTEGVLLTYVGEIEFEQGQIKPGESAIGTVDFLVFDPLRKDIQIGRVWGLNEGIRKVGEAEILEIL